MGRRTLRSAVRRRPSGVSARGTAHPPPHRRGHPRKLITAQRLRSGRRGLSGAARLGAANAVAGRRPVPSGRALRLGAPHLARRWVSHPVSSPSASWWDRRVPDWVCHAGPIEEHFGPYGAVAVEMLDLEPGERVVDVGCGPGFSLPELSRRVGPGGRVLALDVSPSMTAVAARRRASLGNVDVVTADIGACPTRRALDAAFARFVLPLLDDPGLTAIGDAVRHGGRLGFTTWGLLEANPWRHAPALAAAPLLGVPLRMPDPDPTPLATPQAIVAAADRAGWELGAMKRINRERTVGGSCDLVEGDAVAEVLELGDVVVASAVGVG
ncbi:MAG: methyltransferase domain-containing protein, partial [Acidimicrobiales bacterium]